MPYKVNGQPVPEELIREEGGRIGRAQATVQRIGEQALPFVAP